MSTVNSNMSAKVGNFFKRLFVEDGLLENSKKHVSNKISQEIAEQYAKSSRKTVIENIKSGKYKGGLSDGIMQQFDNSSKLSKALEIDTLTGKAAIQQALTHNANIGREGGKRLNAEQMKKLIGENKKALDSKVKYGSFVESAKSYYTKPFDRIKNANLSADERALAGMQFSARVGTTAAGVGLVGTGVHDVFADKENRAGLGGAALNTATMGVVGGGAAGVAAMLRKL